MKIIGLTGGIGSGKSTVATMFRELGVPVYDSDKEAKHLMVTSSELKKAIVDLLGSGAYVHEELNRAYIAKKVFSDSELLEKLNGIVHPAVRKHFQEWVQSQKKPYVIQETALIFENGVQNLYDYVILVTAPIELRLERTIKRDGSSEKEVLERMKNQLDDNLKIDLAHFCITNIDMEQTRARVAELHERLIGFATP
ncbi:MULTISPECIES: dephospho-CoA kinase [Flavobacteriaceae]|uniref:dephospho-CoA kinase n=1 Tax=Flavobacteriaceae TaxID=49546 RepID=UPI0014918125|nr:MULTISPECIES: dephospho-CoA kinase [Allomuricauda]MDC6364955.1 dephospho-CoA kinase [Muricauda sp. AC10]